MSSFLPLKISGIWPTLDPNRELAYQIGKLVDDILPYFPGLVSQVLVGGSALSVDATKFRESGANILIGTPGRVEEMLEKVKELNVKELEILILDEADR
jgi:ATP-dependent RNA helicase DDX55/SPB4